jgi:hypothetical protein
MSARVSLSLLATEIFHASRDDVFALGDYGIAEVTWLSKRELQIVTTGLMVPARPERSWRDVTILYDLTPVC